MEEQSYRRRIAAAAGDPDKLTEIIKELESLGTSVARRLLIEAIARRRQARAMVTKTSASPPPVRPRGWLAELAINEITGDPLYRYPVSEEAVLALKERLCARRTAFTQQPSPDFAGQFVFWAADWFRRHYDGTGLSWEALGAELGVNCEWRHWRQLTDVGLRFWRLPPLRINRRHHRLAAIARQGGFPVAALEKAQGGWAQRYLETLVATLAGSSTPDFETANSIAGRLIEMVPTTWQNSGLQVVSAELALEVVRLRRLAEEKGGLTGALASPWLDQHEPGWRDQLPLSIGSEAGRALIDGLMRTVALRGGHEAVKCYRWLEVGPEGRREGVTLELAGRLEGKAIASNLASEWSRLRLYPAGIFAQHVAGELAVADPEEDGRWRARPSTQRTEFHLPANVPIDVELRGDGRRVSGPFVLSGGEAVTGDLRIYAVDNETDTGARLRLLGSASGGFREDLLVVDMPVSWTIQPHGEESTCEHFAEGRAPHRSISKVTGSAIVTNARGDRYLVRAGQNAATRDRLVVHASNAPFELADTTVRLIIGKPQAHVEERGRPRSAGNEELFWRPFGTNVWRPNITRASVGKCEIAWRDRATGHIRARCDVVVLPTNFAVRTDIAGNFQDVSIEGWPGKVATTQGSPVGDIRWRLPLQGNTCSRFVATLQPDGGEPFDLVIPLRHQAWIESWTQGPTGRDARLSLSVINRYVARSPQPCELMADLLDELGRPVPQGHARWWVDGELPLSTIRDDLAALLRPNGSLRSSVRLDFNDANNVYWYVHEFEHELLDEGSGLVPSPAIAEEGARIAYRVLNNPVQERDAGRYDLLGHRPISPPLQDGDAVVYLRADDRVLSAPRLLRGAGGTEPQDELARAMLIADRYERQSALELVFDQIRCQPTTDEARALVRRLIELVLSLDGLPPATFDALALLPHQPEVATMLLFQARRSELESLIRLEEGLPFAWWLIPKVHWDTAAHVQAEFLFGRLPDEPALVASTIGETRAELCSLEPILAPLLDLSVRPDSLETAANAFLNRSADRIDTSNANPFRTRHSSVLPSWRYNEEFWRALDAPVIAAFAARGQIEMEVPEIRAAKDIARQHPQWFREGFAASYREL